MVSVIRTDAPEKRIIPKPTSSEQGILLHNVGWQSYVTIGEVLKDRPALRMTYDRGELRIMVTSQEHEYYKKLLARMIETLAEEFGFSIATAGNMTFQRQDLERGLEPDDCFWIANEPKVRGKLQWDPSCDPPPDLVLEIEITASSIERMEIYATLGVPEVWRYDGERLQAHLLGADGSYKASDRSPTFPNIPLDQVATFFEPDPRKDYLSMIRDFRAWVGNRKKENGEE